MLSLCLQRSLCQIILLNSLFLSLHAAPLAAPVYAIQVEAIDDQPKFPRNLSRVYILPNTLSDPRTSIERGIDLSPFILSAQKFTIKTGDTLQNGPVELLTYPQVPQTPHRIFCITAPTGPSSIGDAYMFRLLALPYDPSQEYKNRVPPEGFRKWKLEISDGRLTVVPVVPGQLVVVAMAGSTIPLMWKPEYTQETEAKAFTASRPLFRKVRFRLVELSESQLQSASMPRLTATQRSTTLTMSVPRPTTVSTPAPESATNPQPDTISSPMPEQSAPAAAQTVPAQSVSAPPQSIPKQSASVSSQPVPIQTSSVTLQPVPAQTVPVYSQPIPTQSAPASPQSIPLQTNDLPPRPTPELSIISPPLPAPAPEQTIAVSPWHTPEVSIASPPLPVPAPEQTIAVPPRPTPELPVAATPNLTPAPEQTIAAPSPETPRPQSVSLPWRPSSIPAQSIGGPDRANPMPWQTALPMPWRTTITLQSSPRPKFTTVSVPAPVPQQPRPQAVPASIVLPVPQRPSLRSSNSQAAPAQSVPGVPQRPSSIPSIPVARPPSLEFNAFPALSLTAQRLAFIFDEEYGSLDFMEHTDR